MIRRRGQGCRQRAGEHKGRGGARGGDPGARKRAVFNKLLHDPAAEMRGIHQAKRFLEGMDSFPTKADLLMKMTDKRNEGSRCIKSITAFLGSARDVEELLVPLIQHGVHPETLKPLYRELRNKYLNLIFRSPGLLLLLAQENLLGELSSDSANVICSFLLHIAKAVGEARNSEEVACIAENLRDRGDVQDAPTLCVVLMVDEKAKLYEATPIPHRNTREHSGSAACWVSDLVPPGTRHDNDHLNYRDIDIVPTPDELRCQVRPYLPLATGENKIIEDPVNGHLDTHFRLLREDAVSTMRERIAEMKKPWLHARVIGIDLKGPGANGFLTFIVQVDHPDRAISDWSRSRALMQGSVVVLLDENSWLVRTGTITTRRDDQKSAWLNDDDGPKFGVAFNGLDAFDAAAEEMTVNRALNEKYGHASRSDNQGYLGYLLGRMRTFTLLEVSNSFFSYQPVLKALQGMDGLPMAEELVSPRPSAKKVPSYLPQILRFPQDENFKGYKMDLSDISVDDIVSKTSLDASQARAVHHALTSRVSLIQGPPGTGKTFIGGLIAQIILMNTDETLLCICYTNHALDQFLEHMIEYGEERIVRLGGRSKSDKISRYQLRDLTSTKGRRDDQTSTHIKQVDAQIYRMRRQIEELFHILEQPIGWYSPNGGIESVLVDEHPVEYEFLSLPTANDGFSIVGRGGEKLSKDFLWEIWKEGKEFPGFLLAYRMDITDAFVNFWKNPLPMRLDFVGMLENEVSKYTKLELHQAVNELIALTREREFLRQANEMQVLREAKIIGATTTGAARYRDLLSSLSPGVVMVEEAGEIVEAHVLSALSQRSVESNETKHLILIGDHKQLRPKVENYNLSEVSRAGYNLDISLFERLVVGGLPSARLEVQHRMRPSISRFIRAQTYPQLKDHESVFQYPNVKGVCEDVLFIDHDQKEDGADDNNEISTTKSNTYEAKLVVEIVRFFLLQGYGSDRIVVLTPYLGQLFKIVGLMRENLKEVETYISENDLEKFDGDEYEELERQRFKSRNTSVRCSSIDNYQGEENDIVVISLVRSNASGAIGFLKEPQRVNVLLSRARHGMYLIGNSRTLLQTPSGRKTWEPLIQMLQESNQLRTGLPTVCQLHSEDDPIELRLPKEFRLQRPNGGCTRPCRYRLPCGHVCPQMCHLIDQDHNYALKVCAELCRRIPPECKRDHPCKKLCRDTCGPCSFPVGPMPLSCGHISNDITCHDTRSTAALELFTSKCSHKVQFTFEQCGHSEDTKCSNARSDNPTCPAVCGIPKQGCQHPCTKTCGECKGGHCCDEKCERTIFCGHVCEKPCHLPDGCKPCNRPCAVKCSHSTCPKRCKEPCASCVEPCDWTCEHQGQCDLVCSAPCTRLPCNKRCTKELSCGHQCPSLCGEDCPRQQYCVECGSKTARKRVVDMIMFETYEDHDLDTDPVIFLSDCGHFFATSTLDGHIGLDLAYERESQDDSFIRPRPLLGSDISDKSKQCPECRAPITMVRRYGRITKFSCLRSLERKHMTMYDEAIVGLSAKDPHQRSVKILNMMVRDIRASPMRQVYEACTGSEGSSMVEVQLPPDKPLIRCLELLGETYATDEYKLQKAVETFEEAIMVAQRAKMIRSEATVRIAMASSLARWVDHNAGIKSKFFVQLEFVIKMTSTRPGIVDDLIRQARELKEHFEGIRKREIQEIIRAMMKRKRHDYDYGASASSHWYECPNGHPYFIGECGRAMQESRCSECNELVGGTGHNLLRTNRLWTGYNDFA